MTVRWVLDTYAFTFSWLGNLWQTHALRHLPHRLQVRRHLGHQAGCLSWRLVQSAKRQGLRGWLRQRVGVAQLSTSACRASSSLSHRMSRLRSTLESVSKAVSGTHSELLSRIARLKLASLQAGRGPEVAPETRAESPGSGAAPATEPLREEGSLPAETPIPANESLTLMSTPANGTLTPASTPANESLAPATTQTNASLTPPPTQASGKLTPPPTQANGGPAPPSTKSGPSVSTGTAVTKSTAELFHPSYLAANLGETYSYLAHHVNAYFGSAVKVEEKKAEHTDGSASAKASVLDPGGPLQSAGGHVPVPVPVSDRVSPEPAALTAAPDVAPPAPAPPTSPKKSIGQYLTNPGPSVQAFVGSYIAPLVPKFRSESKSIAVEKDKPPLAEEAALKPVETAESKEQKAAEDRAKRLLLQREKIIARVSVDNRTRALVQALHRASDVKLYIRRVEDLSYHLLEFPETRGVAVKEKVVSCLLRLRQASDPTLQAAVREALALVGYSDPVRGRGIRVLSIDGGGTRGLVALQTLHRLEDLTGKPIYQLFDYICGVSTGAILAFMLGVFQIPLNECEEMYRRLGSDVFKQNVIVGTVKMGWSHAFYDSEAWETILKERMGPDLMVETARNPRCPKVAAVSTLVNRGTPLKAYVFRNYNLQPGVRSHYLGSCQHKLWQAIRASSAAPGYFQEFVLGNDLHQDGGLLINNPTALAIHECRCLWPNTPLQCVVSLGTGRFESLGKNSATYTSLKAKLSNVISSATDTEEVHTMLDALLPPDTYFRFNPFMNEDIALDESRREKLNLLQTEGMRYLERNEEKLRKAAGVLLREKSRMQRLAEWLRLKADMYDGLPFFSKL
ncbi:calcium-independent phospholipase A2-gamma-like [Megalops cyprinoides]|uniref:calcium-independent phospholipase A2-gamma-like n=1 Tax=Megalops cyprinoides TaxID=118141 RepID=UPI001864D433|nr:calcium-independent phospholipase A2-gamma-like [Megalops cyprinoides]